MGGKIKVKQLKEAEARARIDRLCSDAAKKVAALPEFFGAKVFIDGVVQRGILQRFGAAVVEEIHKQVQRAEWASLGVPADSNDLAPIWFDVEQTAFDPVAKSVNVKIRFDGTPLSRLYEGGN